MSRNILLYCPKNVGRRRHSCLPTYSFATSSLLSSNQRRLLSSSSTALLGGSSRQGLQQSQQQLQRFRNTLNGSSSKGTFATVPTPSDATYSSHEYPWATEPPVITKTTAAEAAVAETQSTKSTTTTASTTTVTTDPTSKRWWGNMFPSSSSTSSIASMEGADATSVSSSSSVSSSESSVWMGRVASNSITEDVFDDTGTLTPEERNEKRLRQRETINTKVTQFVEPITTTVPVYIPPNVPSAQLKVPETILTTLDNGLRVVSQETYGQVCTIGIVANFGSRYEQLSRDTRGVTHLLELAAFGAAGLDYPSAAAIARQLQEWGGTRYVSSGREQTVHAIDLLRPNVNHAVEMLSDVMIRPHFFADELEEAKQAIRFAASMPDHMPPELLLSEAIQTAAYGSDQQLGQPYICPVEALDAFSRENALAHWNAHYVHNPRGMVVGGAGVAHDDFVRIVERQFGHLVQSPDADETSSANSTTTTRYQRTPIIPSVYRGGHCQVQIPAPNSDVLENGLDQQGAAMSVVEAHQRLTRLAIGFEVGGWHSPDLVATCVLQTLLGGGSSFSAGGPGKGMYSRLYRQVLNKFNWAESTEAFTAFHNESGLMGIAGSTSPQHVHSMVRVFCLHMKKLANEPVSMEELNRARNMLKNNVLTQLESRLILFEDMARQVLTYGQREHVRMTCERIEAVTAADIQDIVQRALTKPPTVAAVGVDLLGVPNQEQVIEMLQAF